MALVFLAYSTIIARDLQCYASCSDPVRTCNHMYIS